MGGPRGVGARVVSRRPRRRRRALVAAAVGALLVGPAGREDAPFVEYAWGDRRFYMESNFWPHVVFATLFLPTESVAYVDGWPRAPGPSDGARSLSRADVDG